MEKEGMIPELPEAFRDRVRRQLGAEWPAFESAMEQPAIRGLRMNPFRAGSGTPFRDAGREIPWMPGGYEIPLNSPAGITAAHEGGAFYLQDPSAMIPAAVLDPKPGEILLDLCAAPGGKSTQMGLALAGEGLLVCNEPVPKRAAVLSRNLERMGIPNSVVTCAYPRPLAERWPEAFDGVLADAPCSGEGMFRRHPETRAEWTPEKAAGCAERQREILDEAAKMVRPGGRLVYATCTWNPAENEEQVERFLERHPEFETEPFALPGVDGGTGCFTCWPHRIRGEGQFTALLRKGGNAPARMPGGEADFRLSPEQRKAWEASGIGGEEPNAAFGRTLIRLERIPELRGIQTLRLGLHLGELRGKIFLPDHAAAMCIRMPSAPRTEMSEADALRYLAGETVAGGTNGWTVMTWQGIALGWGKGSGGVIRNHYPKGLRNGRLTG